MKQMTITVTANAMEKWEQTASCRPPQVVARTFEVIIDFLLRVDGARTKGLVITMEARERWQNDDYLRDELIKSARSEPRWYAAGGFESENFDEWTIEIIDPHGVLKWFGMDQAADLFKQNSSNAKPLRLPAARFD
jgi:hypothetical protein